MTAFGDMREMELSARSGLWMVCKILEFSLAYGLIFALAINKCPVLVARHFCLEPEGFTIRRNHHTFLNFLVLHKFAQLFAAE